MYVSGTKPWSPGDQNAQRLKHAERHWLSEGRQLRSWVYLADFQYLESMQHSPWLTGEWRRRRSGINGGPWQDPRNQGLIHHVISDQLDIYDIRIEIINAAYVEQGIVTDSQADGLDAAICQSR